MVWTLNQILSISFIVLTVSYYVFAKYIFFFKKGIPQRNNELALMDLELKEEKRQQQVLYNISTSIFLINKKSEIIGNTLSEINIMYEWPNVSFLPKDSDKPFVFGIKPTENTNNLLLSIEKGIETYSIKSQGINEYIGIFPVGHKGNLLGLLYVNKIGKAITRDQLSFFKSIASFLTIALENSKEG